MSRLYALTRTIAEVASHFAADNPGILSSVAELTEGSTGPVVFERDGRRLLRFMRWGFPRFTREMRVRGEDLGIIGLVADLTNPMWEHLVVDARYRCLIPLTHFANPDGAPGAKTRTWFSVKDQPIAAWAGFCRNLPGHGPNYAGMTMTANAAVMPTNDRMPVLLGSDEHDRWLHGSIEDVIEFQFRDPIPADRLHIDRTDDRWRSGIGPPGSDGQFALI